jgi:TatD DNase family protein
VSAVLVDVHAHLAGPRFDDDRGEVLRRAHEAGVAAVLVVGEDLADDERVREVTSAPRAAGAAMIPCFGLHPDRFAEDREPPSRTEIDAVKAMIKSAEGHLAAIGEVGLDRHWVKTDERRRAQEALLEELAALSVETGLALNVHSRAAGKYTIDLLIASGATRVLMHAFDGKATYAVRGADAGFLFSIPPSAIRSEQKHKLLSRLPLDALMLESDSPVLGPERGVRNEPANLALTVDFLAERYGVDASVVAEVTTQNARRLFPALDSVLAASLSA